MKRLVVWLISLSLLAGAALFVVANYSWRWLNSPLSNEGGGSEDIKLTIEKGQTLSQIAASLNANGNLEYPRLWLEYAKYTQQANKVQAGQYTIARDLTPIEFLDQLVRGAVDFKKLTIVEGSRFADVVKKLRANPYIVSDEKSLAEKEIRASLGIEDEMPLEGWFFPDTLVFAEGTSALTLLIQGKDKMLSVLNEEWRNREENLPYESAYEALIMASIVEKETGRASERQQIAGVFVRRLRKGMRLQTDPTVIYGLGDSYNGNITRKHLRTDTPYNTYTRFGLPPSPIALPGREAIHAALHPAKGDALFFVAKGDGSHYFSATLAEHENAVTKYQRTRRKDYRSAP